MSGSVEMAVAEVVFIHCLRHLQQKTLVTFPVFSRMTRLALYPYLVARQRRAEIYRHTEVDAQSPLLVHRMLFQAVGQDFGQVRALWADK